MPDGLYLTGVDYPPEFGIIRPEMPIWLWGRLKSKCVLMENLSLPKSVAGNARTASIRSQSARIDMSISLSWNLVCGNCMCKWQKVVWNQYSGLTLNQYGVASPCRTICTVCGFVALSWFKVNPLYKDFQTTFSFEETAGQVMSVLHRRNRKFKGQDLCFYIEGGNIPNVHDRLIP